MDAIPEGVVGGETDKNAAAEQFKAVYELCTEDDPLEAGLFAAETHLRAGDHEASLELYFPLFVHEEENLHHVISVSSRLGLIDGHHDTDEIPIFERFFLGGPNTVRGFDFRGLGPQFFGDALGGTAAWYGNVEYVFPIFKKFLRGVLFFDYGNLESAISSFDLDRMRFAAGVGIRVNFPFLGTPLPVGLYIGEAFQHEDDDDTKVFLFTIGAPF